MYFFLLNKGHSKISSTKFFPVPQTWRQVSAHEFMVRIELDAGLENDFRLANVAKLTNANNFRFLTERHCLLFQPYMWSTIFAACTPTLKF